MGGVPPQSIAVVRDVVTDDHVLALASTLPAEAAEAPLVLATGGVPEKRPTVPVGSDPFEHPDAQQRFRVMEDAEALAGALDAPWDQWTVFLHPAQRQWMEREQSGPARVSGSAGTGKTIVAVHRAVHLARRDEEARVLLTTFTPMLANVLHARMRRQVGRTPRLGERIDVVALEELALRLHRFAFGAARLASEEEIGRRLAEAITAELSDMPARFGKPFFLQEWTNVVDTWQIDRWEAYRDVRRLGRKTRLTEAQRAATWRVFEQVRASLAADALITVSGVFARLADHYASGTTSPFTHVVVDEAQDLGVQQLRFLSALTGDRPNGLFFAGDLGQRIFRTPFSWKALGGATSVVCRMHTSS